MRRARCPGPGTWLVVRAEHDLVASPPFDMSAAAVDLAHAPRPRDSPGIRAHRLANTWSCGAIRSEELAHEAV